MRIFEITRIAPGAARKPLPVVATKRFKKNYAIFLRKYPGLQKRFEDFAKFKRANPNEPWDKKDYAFTAGVIKGIEHAHIVHGKVLVIYLVENGEVRFYDMVDHSAVENQNFQSAMAKFVKTTDEFEAIDLSDDTEAAAFNASVREVFNDLLSSPEVLRDVSKGDLKAAVEVIKLFVDAPDDKIIATFGGPEGMAQAAEKLLRRNGYHYLLNDDFVSEAIETLLNLHELRKVFS